MWPSDTPSWYFEMLELGDININAKPTHQRHAREYAKIAILVVVKIRDFARYQFHTLAQVECAQLRATPTTTHKTRRPYTRTTSIRIHRATSRHFAF